MLNLFSSTVLPRLLRAICVLNPIPSLPRYGIRTSSTWLESYGLPLNDAAVFIDDDLDGLLNGEEFAAGTDPTNALSGLWFNDISVTDGRQILSWQAVAGKNYTIWFKTNLNDSTWFPQAAGIPGIEPDCIYTVTVDSANGFMRIGLD